MAKSARFIALKNHILAKRIRPKLFSAQHDYLVLPALSATVGALTGLVIASFEAIILWLNQQRLQFVNLDSLSPLTGIILTMLIGGLMVVLALWLVRRFAPEAGSSGVTHIEGALDGIYEINWRRLLPIKFVASVLAISSGMIFGRAGPSVQLGGVVGRMMADTAKRYTQAIHVLTAAGAAAGLAAAFNAPLAGILFVIEEMRPQFRYSMTSIKCVSLAAATATIVMQICYGQQAIMAIPDLSIPSLTSLWLFLLLGILFGVVGVLFNRGIIASTRKVQDLQANKMSRVLLFGLTLGALFSLLQIFIPEGAGTGRFAMLEVLQHPITLVSLLGLFLLRLFGTILCFSSGAAGGVFTPMLTLGTLFGLAFGMLAGEIYPDLATDPLVYAVAGMGALFAATVRAPVTGIMLVVEMTDSYHMILPLLVTCLGATFIAQLLGGKPLYAELLALSLSRQESQVAGNDKDKPATN